MLDKYLQGSNTATSPQQWFMCCLLYFLWTFVSRWLITYAAERKDAGTWAFWSENSTASSESSSRTCPNGIVCWASFSTCHYWEEPAGAASCWWWKISAVSGTFAEKILLLILNNSIAPVYLNGGFPSPSHKQHSSLSILLKIIGVNVVFHYTVSGCPVKKQWGVRNLQEGDGTGFYSSQFTLSIIVSALNLCSY